MSAINGASSSGGNTTHTSGATLLAGSIIVLGTIMVGNTKAAPIIMGVQGVVILALLFKVVGGGTKTNG